MTSTRDSTIQNFRRYEFKYIVNNSSAELIRQDLLEFLEYDPLLKQSGDKSYTVRSLYFDSPAREHFYEKIDLIYILYYFIHIIYIIITSLEFTEKFK